MVLQTRTLVGAAGAALVLAVVAWMTVLKPVPQGTVEISATSERAWSVEISEVRQ